jgi:hypothetical protein
MNPWKSNTLEWTAPVEHIHGNWPGDSKFTVGLMTTVIHLTMLILYLKMFQWKKVKKFYITKIYTKALYENRGFFSLIKSVIKYILWFNLKQLIF